MQGRQIAAHWERCHFPRRHPQRDQIALQQRSSGTKPPGECVVVGTYWANDLRHGPIMDGGVCRRNEYSGGTGCRQRAGLGAGGIAAFLSVPRRRINPGTSAVRSLLLDSLRGASIAALPGRRTMNSLPQPKPAAVGISMTLAGPSWHWRFAARESSESMPQRQQDNKLQRGWGATHSPASRSRA